MTRSAQRRDKRLEENGRAQEQQQRSKGSKFTSGGQQKETREQVRLKQHVSSLAGKVLILDRHIHILPFLGNNASPARSNGHVVLTGGRKEVGQYFQVLEEDKCDARTLHTEKSASGNHGAL